MIRTADVYRPLYENRDKFIVLVTGGRGCEDPSTPVLMADLTVKAIKDVKAGEQVMGDDGTPRNVLRLFSGSAPMYRVRQSRGAGYSVTGNHELALLEGGKRTTMRADAFCSLSAEEKARYKGYRVERGEWSPIAVEIAVEPIGEGEYRGVGLDGNNLYLHADGTVTHNSGKSFALGTFIERLTFETGSDEQGGVKPHVVLYTRYSMPSAKMSVIPEVKEKIDLDGTSQFFHVTQTDIVNELTGGRIMFRGIMVSTKNQTAKLKSIQGITTFVCDEAEEFVDEDSYDKLSLSIRQTGIQNRVVIIMNPADSSHFIYRKYIKDTHRLVDFDGVPVQISTHPDVLHIHTTWLDNREHLSEQFVREMEAMREQDPEKYAHVAMGRWVDRAEGAVFKDWEECDEFPARAKRVAAGVDFGYTNDPSACVRCGVVGDDLYLDEVFYRRGMLISDLARELLELGLPVYPDSADPRLLQELSNKGVIIYPVSKGAGSVMAGIERMKEFRRIYVTRRSENLKEELRNYVWAKDRYGNPINYPEDRDNHACDAARYWCLGNILGQVMSPRAYDPSRLGIF